MTTKNIVPRFDGEGGIGTNVKKWGVGYFNTPPAGDNSNKIATTEYVQVELADYSPSMVGEVKMYAGQTAPAGWLVCDGSAVSRETYADLFAVVGTTYGSGDGSTTFNLPNMINRMVVGAGGNYALGATGGEAAHALTEPELAIHTHTFTGSSVKTDNEDTAHTHARGSLDIQGAFFSRRYQVSSGHGSIVTDGSNAIGVEQDSYSNNALKVTSGDSTPRTKVTFKASNGWSGSLANESASHKHNVTAAGSNSNTGSGTAHNNMPPYIGLKYIIKY